jgi:hypothetical protein
MYAVQCEPTPKHRYRRAGRRIHAATYGDPPDPLAVAAVLAAFTEAGEPPE